MTTRRAVFLPLNSKLLEALKSWLTVSNDEGLPLDKDVLIWQNAASSTMALLKVQLGKEQEKALQAFTLDSI